MCILLEISFVKVIPSVHPSVGVECQMWLIRRSRLSLRVDCVHELANGFQPLLNLILHVEDSSQHRRVKVAIAH